MTSEGAAAADQSVKDGTPDAASEQVEMMEYFMQLEYHELLAPIVRRYADCLMEGRIIGHKCPKCGLVYVPPRGYCPIDVIETGEADEVTLENKGTVGNYTIVTPVQYYGQEETEPFVRASIVLDPPGGMMSLQDILDVPVDEVRVGMRVEAAWLPEGERTTAELSNRSWGSAEGVIRGWRPTGEPDVPADQLVNKAF